MDDRVTYGMMSFWGSFLLTSFYYFMKDMHYATDRTWEKTEIRYERGIARQKPSWQDYVRVLWIVIRNMIVSCAVGHLMFQQLDSGASNIYRSWSWTEYLVGFVITLLALETVFYFVHRALHHPKLFTHSLFDHALHHSPLTGYDEPFALAAMYCSIFELIFVNLFSVLAGPIITDMPCYPLVIWLGIVGWDVAVGHGGHQWFTIHDTSFHDTHHHHRTVHYGVFGIFDLLCNTMNKRPVRLLMYK